MNTKIFTPIVLVSAAAVLLCALAIAGYMTGSINVAPANGSAATPASEKTSIGILSNPTATPTAGATPASVPPATPATTATATPTAAPATPTPDAGDLPWIDYDFRWASGGSGSDSLKVGLPDNLDYSIVITGGTTSPVTLTYQDLRAMNMVRMNASMPKHDGSIVTSEWVGIPTTDILAKAGLPGGPLQIDIKASDGFGGVFTADQLRGTMIGLMKNGTACDTVIKGGKAIMLVVPGEYGSSWVQVPTSIDISQA